MSHIADIKLLTKQLESQWATAAGDKSVVLLFENAAAAATQPTKFIRLHVRPGSEKKTNLGNNRHRIEREGRVWVHVAIPKATSSDIAWAIAGKVSAIYSSWRSPDGYLRCDEIVTDVVPSDTHYMIAVKVHYRSIRTEF